MSYRSFKGYVMVIASGIVIFATMLLLVLQWGNTTNLSLYGKNISANTAVVMLGSAVSGMLLFFLVKILIHGVLVLHNDRKLNRLQEAENRLARLERQGHKQES